MCEFCDRPAEHSHPIVKGKLYVYACEAHVEKAIASVTGKRVGKPMRRRDQEERLFDVNKLPKVE